MCFGCNGHHPPVRQLTAHLTAHHKHAPRMSSLPYVHPTPVAQAFNENCVSDWSKPVSFIMAASIFHWDLISHQRFLRFFRLSTRSVSRSGASQCRLPRRPACRTRRPACRSWSPRPPPSPCTGRCGDSRVSQLRTMASHSTMACHSGQPAYHGVHHHLLCRALGGANSFGFSQPQWSCLKVHV